MKETLIRKSALNYELKNEEKSSLLMKSCSQDNMYKGMQGRSKNKQKSSLLIRSCSSANVYKGSKEGYMFSEGRLYKGIKER